MTKNESDIIKVDHLTKSAIFEIQSYMEGVEKDAELYEEKNFDKRMEVIDFIDFQVIGRIDDLLQKTAQTDKLTALKFRAEKAKAELEAIDIELFKKLGSKIRKGEYTGERFKNLVKEYTGFNLDHTECQEDVGYDNLDIFINGLCSSQHIPEQTKDLEPEMVFYQKTPTRVVFELVEKTNFSKNDVFFDLGSGLGQVAILVNLLTGITAKGVEFEPAFCNYARNCAAELNLPNVSFINADARKADYSQGTVFYMYTPFKGAILQEVLTILQKEAHLRKIKIITYGPCTAQVALQSWLNPAAPNNDNIYKLCVFTSA